MPLFRPKEKVGENPPDNDDADPIRKRDYTERRGEGQARRVPFPTAQCLNLIAEGNAYGKCKEQNPTLKGSNELRLIFDPFRVAFLRRINSGGVATGY